MLLTTLLESLLFMKQGGACTRTLHTVVIVSVCMYYCVICRSVLVESARIARGSVSPLSQLNVTDFDAVVFPGGFGAAKNL